MPGFIQIQKQRNPSAEMLSRMMMQVYAMKLEDKHRDKAEQRQIAKEKRARAALEKFMKEPLNIKTQGKRAFLRTPKGWTELSQPKVKALVGEVREWADTHKGKIPTPQQLTTHRKQKAAEVLANQKNLVKFKAKLDSEKIKEPSSKIALMTRANEGNVKAQAVLKRLKEYDLAIAGAKTQFTHDKTMASIGTDILLNSKEEDVAELVKFYNANSEKDRFVWQVDERTLRKDVGEWVKVPKRRELSDEKAAEYLRKASGNINKAKEMAKKEGWSFD